MPLKDEIQKSIVIVNGGSGCLIQPMDANKLYILTAKHVLEEANAPAVPEIQRWVTENGNGQYVPIPFHALEPEVNYFPHPHLDAAILVIDAIDDFVPRLQIDDAVVWGGVYELCGYPQARRDDLDKFRPDPIIVKQPLHLQGLREGSIADGTPRLEEIQGQSGGGLIRCTKGYLLLAGIQTQMACPDEVEQLGRVKFIEISVFSDLIASKPALKPLLPFYMDSFQHFRGKAMALQTPHDSDVRVTRTFLQDITSSIIETNLRPLDIKNQYGDRLLVWDRAGSLLDEKVWVSFLELFIVMHVCDYPPITTNTLKACLNRFRLLYANFDDDWTMHAEEIMKSDFLGLAKDGVVIVSTPYLTNDFSLTGIVENIAFSREDQRIDQGCSVYDFRYIHIFALQRLAILSKTPEYRDFKPGNTAPLRKRLKEEFENILYG